MRVKPLLREPLLHFLAIGGALFLYFHWSGGSGPASNRIVVGAGQIKHLGVGFVQAWRRPPTDDEMKGLIDDWVREEIAVREAMAAGLDRDDTVIRRRLRQKFEFVLEDATADAPPTDAELQAWLDVHADVYRTETQVAFRQVYLNPDRHGASVDADAREILAHLHRAGSAARIDELGDPTMLAPDVALEPRSDVASSFGEEFAGRVETIAPGEWTGPIPSGYGLHLVFVRERVVGSLPGLAAIRPAVERDYLSHRRAQQLSTMYERLLEKYTVVVERPAKGGS